MTEKLLNDHKHVRINDLEILIRPITPNDEALEAAFVHNLSIQTKYERFFEGIRDLSPSSLKMLCNIDYVNTMAYIAIVNTNEGEKQIGVCRYSADKLPGACEMAVTVADNYPFQEIAAVLLDALIEHAKSNNKKSLFATELSTNYKMQMLAKQFDMDAKPEPSDAGLVIYTLHL